jgi:hypothetical protein
LLDAFKVENYQGSLFNLPDFYNFMNIFMIKIMDQYDKCSYSEFLLTVDNRLSDVAFVSGLTTRVGTELF